MNESQFRPTLRLATVAVIVAAMAAAMPTAVLAGSAQSTAQSTAQSSAVASAPAFDPNNFNGGPIDNKWFPLTPGTTLVYKGTKDGKKGTDIVHVTHRTKIIEGVPCVVVEDTLVLAGRVEEHTLDWYAQDIHGNVWYLGERTATFDRKGNVVDTEGTWMTGRDGAQAGIFMPAHPHVGDTFRQEYYPGHAEDHFRIMSLDASVTVPYGSFDHAMRTREWTPLEPDVRDAKFYVKGIGEVKEIAVRGPLEVLRLVQIIHD
jgi:hypothetical protein